MDENNMDNPSRFFVGFMLGSVAGAVAGALTGLLVAPQTGAESRAFVRAKAGEAGTRGKELVSRGQGALSQEAQEILDVMRPGLEKAAEANEETREELKKHFANKVDEISAESETAEAQPEASQETEAPKRKRGRPKSTASE